MDGRRWSAASPPPAGGQNKPHQTNTQEVERWSKEQTVILTSSVNEEKKPDENVKYVPYVKHYKVH